MEYFRNNIAGDLPEGSISRSIYAGEYLGAVILPRYEIADPRRCVLMARGINDSYLVSTGSGRFVLRVYRSGWRSLPQIEAELVAIDQIVRCGLSVSIPLQAADGSTVQVLAAPEGVRFAVLFSYAEGRPLDYTNAREAALLGRFAGELHVAQTSHPGELSRRG